MSAIWDDRMTCGCWTVVLDHGVGTKVDPLTKSIEGFRMKSFTCGMNCSKIGGQRNLDCVLFSILMSCPDGELTIRFEIPITVRHPVCPSAAVHLGACMDRPRI